MPKVSICIAVYNVEKYIEQCVRSLFELTLDDLEYIFVDDASPDASIDVMLRVLEDYPHRKNQVKLIRHETNQGVAVTRKDAIAAATGDYIIHCDPDDWVELDMYERLYTKAKQKNADLVYCGSISENETEQQKCPGIINTAGNLMESVLAHNCGNLCNKLFKLEITQASDIKYNDSLKIAEDLCLTLQFIQKVNICDELDEFLYHYRINNNTSITKRADNLKLHIDAIDFASSVICDFRYIDAFDLYKVKILLRCLFNNSLSAEKWHSLWKESKRNFLHIKYPITMKIIFYSACVNYTLTIWCISLVRKIKNYAINIFK